MFVNLLPCDSIYNLILFSIDIILIQISSDFLLLHTYHSLLLIDIVEREEACVHALLPIASRARRLGASAATLTSERRRKLTRHHRLVVVGKTRIVALQRQSGKARNEHVALLVAQQKSVCPVNIC